MYYVPQRALAGLDPWATPQVYDNIGEFFRTGYVWNNFVNVIQGLMPVIIRCRWVIPHQRVLFLQPEWTGTMLNSVVKLNYTIIGKPVSPVILSHQRFRSRPEQTTVLLLQFSGSAKL